MTSPQAKTLVSISLILTVLIEVLPTEVDFKLAAFENNNLLQYLIVKAVGLGLILLPLALFVWINGWHGINAVKSRVVAIGIIVVLQLMGDASLLVHWLMRR